jgi:hypothetical protein
LRNLFLGQRLRQPWMRFRRGDRLHEADGYCPGFDSETGESPESADCA